MMNWAKDPTRRQRQAERLRNIMKRLWANPSYIAQRNKLMRKYWDDPAWRKRQSEITKEVCNQEQIKANIRSAAISRWRNPTLKMRQAQSKNIAKRWSDPRQRQLMSARMSNPESPARKGHIKYMADPINRQTMIAGIRKARKKRWADPEQRKALSETMRARWANIDFKRDYMERLNNPAKKQARSLRILALWTDNRFRQKRSKSLSRTLTRLWLDNDYKEKRLKQLMGGWGRRPTEPEMVIRQLLESSYPGEFTYNGNQAGTVLSGTFPIS